MAALDEASEMEDSVRELDNKSESKPSVWKLIASHMHSRRMRVTELFSIIDKDKNKVVYILLSKRQTYYPNIVIYCMY
jgi:5-keto 4-deoxyuronate isomerase